MILVGVSGWGARGPASSYLAYGGNISAAVGLTASWGFPHGAHNDYVAAYHAVLAATVAMYVRDRSGCGVFIDLSQFEAGLAVTAVLFFWQHRGLPR